MILDEFGFPVTRFSYDPDGDKAVVQTSQDTQPALERNKRLQNDPIPDDPTLGRYIGSIPLIFVSKWLHEDGVNYLRLGKKELNDFLKKKLNDPDYKFLKTTPGRV